jgi:hypothetical protein
MLDNNVFYHNAMAYRYLHFHMVLCPIIQMQ